MSTSITEWQGHAEKLTTMLSVDASNRQQALTLLDALIDSARVAGVASLFSPIFIGADLVDGSFKWMRDIEDDLYWNDKRAFNKENLFWPLYEMFVRLYPDRPMDLPSAITLGKLKKIPTFLQGPNSVDTLVIKSPCETLKGMNQLQNVTTVAFDMSDSDFEELLDSGDWDYRKMAVQKKNFTIVLNSESVFVVEDGTVLIAKGCFAKGLDSTTLLTEPNIQVTSIPFMDLQGELWNAQTPHDFLDLGMFRLRLIGDVNLTIAERVESIHIFWSWDHKKDLHRYFNQFKSNCILANVLQEQQFPNLKVLTGDISNFDDEQQIHITPKILDQTPKLETIYFDSSGPVNFEECWSNVHPLTSIVVVGYERFVVFAFSKEQGGTFKERFAAFSSDADRFLTSDFDFEPYANVAMGHLFDADNDLSFVKHFAGIQRFTIEQDLYTLRQRFDSMFTEEARNYSDFVDYYPAELTERMQMPKVERSNTACKASSLKDIIFYHGAKISYVTSEVLIQELREHIQNQSFPSSFSEWLTSVGMIRVRNYCLWIANGVVKMKTYITWGQQYLNHKKSYGGILNLERLLFGLPQGTDHIFPLSMNSVRYNDSTIPVLGLLGISNLKRLYVEIPVNLEDIVQLTSVEVLYLNDLGLKSLPDSIAQMVNLKELYIWGNDLEELPLSLGKLKALEVINISGNKFTDIPEILLSMQALKKICLRGATSSLEQLKQQDSNFSDRLESGEVTIVDCSVS